MYIILTNAKQKNTRIVENFHSLLMLADFTNDSKVLQNELNLIIKVQALHGRKLNSNVFEMSCIIFHVNHACKHPKVFLLPVKAPIKLVQAKCLPNHLKGT